ncbi:MAG: amidohydrolase [Proteobacteria bacterium]|nr:amidohydrolase [Desulfobacula sp.]MBU4130218.1 amidohydrolase [Pseudomonadota bacterium]
MKQLRVALVIQKSIPGAFEKNLSACLKAVSLAASQNADMVVFPELNLTGYMAGPKISSIATPVSGQWVQSLTGIADQLDICILAGIAEKADNSHIYASHLVFSPCKPLESYRKIHTAPNEKSYLSPGNTAGLFAHKTIRFGIQLCYDAHFPELSTRMAVQGADIVFIPHASPRGSSLEKYQSWMRHLTARAFDNGIFIAAVNQTGDNTRGLIFPGLALLIGPDGNIVSKCLDSKENIHIVDIDLSALDRVRSHRMRYFLPNRRSDLFGS